MPLLLRRFTRHALRSMWSAVIPTFLLLVLALTLTAVTNADTTAVAEANAQAIAQTQPGTPVCESCHQEAGVIWETSTHAATGKVTCESCHGEYKEGHPKAETMLLPMESKTCETCHAQEFAEWEMSEHGAKGLDCYDCHQAHTQGLRLGSQNELCAACHTNEQTTLAHSVHGITGIDCSGCHMTAVARPGATGGTEMMSNHTFTVASDVCMRCHSNSVHPETAVSKTAAPKVDEVSRAAAATSQRVAELEQAVNEAEARNTDLRNIAVAGMGLTFGIGGILGLIVGVMATALFGKRKQS
jgi:hypothetical protein